MTGVPWIDLPSVGEVEDSRIAEQAIGCPCWRAEQVDPECPIHGRPEFRYGGSAA